MAPVPPLGRPRRLAACRRQGGRPRSSRGGRVGDGALRLGVLGGTFDPVHFGHLILGEEAREQLNLDRVIFVPAGQPWRKAGRRIASAEDRLAMLRLAIEDNPAFELEDLELLHQGPSYTADTLASLKEKYPGVKMYFLLGQDALADLPNWHDPGKILALATLAVAARDGDAQDTTKLQPSITSRVVPLSMPVIDISGSDIRRRIGTGRSIRYRVPSSVESYIRDRGLYRD